MKCAGDAVAGEPEECSSIDDVAASDDGSGGDKTVVLVGVRLDSQSKELLSWALVKVAQSGDQVIALHILNPEAEGKSTLISLMKTFDSIIAAYEGFCNLKQVDLKLKVCRGASARKILVQEAKSYGAASLILGTSKVHHTIRSQVSVAKYCARHLPKKFSVLAVDNGKILFQRVAAASLVPGLKDDDWKKQYVRKIGQSLSKKHKEPNVTLAGAAAPKSVNVSEENSLALVPFKSKQMSESKHGWALLSKAFLPSRQQSDKCSVKKTVIHWVLRLPSKQYVAAVYPDQKRSNCEKDEDDSTNHEENVAIVPIGGHTALSPLPNNFLKSFSKEIEDLTEKYSSVIRLFSYQELCSATSNFLPVNMIGKGGSSEVYKGHLPDGNEVAVKILKPSEDAFQQFVSEIEIISSLHHNNIISLLGFSVEAYNLLLVYDFLSRGSLEENLHGKKGVGGMFGWDDRYKVALHVAEALEYLHVGCPDPVIHRDVKSSNILLSDDFEAQLADFGLAMHASESLHDMTTVDVAGTFGYLAPEYFMHGKVNDKIDVYAYGVILLELLSGKKPIDNGNPKGQESLVMWAKPIVKDGKVSELLDSRLANEYNHDEAERMLLTASLCTRHSPILRPKISMVLKLLQGDMEVIEWARQQVTGSEEPDSAGCEEIPANIQSHLNLALLGLEDDSPSTGSSTEQNISIEDYLLGRWSRSSSFD